MVNPHLQRGITMEKNITVHQHKIFTGDHRSDGDTAFSSNFFRRPPKCLCFSLQSWEGWDWFAESTMDQPSTRLDFESETQEYVYESNSIVLGLLIGQLISDYTV